MPIVTERPRDKMMPAEREALERYEKTKKVGWFEVLKGRHTEGGVTYLKGERVESVSDLTQHNQPPNSMKFLKVDGPKESGEPMGSLADPGDPDNPVGVNTGWSREELEKATREDLFSLAHEEGLMLDSKMKKEDIIKHLLGEGDKV